MAKDKKQQTRTFESDGKDIEFSQERADQDDLEAQERSNAADRRAKKQR